MNYWLMKSEPDVYSIDHLKRDHIAPWTGVRNYQARNFMRDQMKKGDWVLYYHSSTLPPGVAGLARVHRESHPDPTQFDRKSEYFDPKSKKENPTWMMVSVAFVEKFPRLVTLDELKNNKSLAGMRVVQPGSRLSVQPVSHEHFQIITQMAKS
jgi:predicted RNA-binding protein with PUA-like domain